MIGSYFLDASPSVWKKIIHKNLSSEKFPTVNKEDVKRLWQFCPIKYTPFSSNRENSDPQQEFKLDSTRATAENWHLKDCTPVVNDTY